VTDEEFALEMLHYWGWRHTALIVGNCLVWIVTGKTAEDVENAPERSTMWRVKRDLRKFRDHLIAEGKWSDGEEAKDEDRMVARVGRLRIA
jgi:hypothetical protein